MVYAEWDGWEEVLVDSFLGREEEDEKAWFKDFEAEEDHTEAEDEHDDTFPDRVMELKTNGKRRLLDSPLILLPSCIGLNPGLPNLLCCIDN
jgi:hypothetical protein